MAPGRREQIMAVAAELFSRQGYHTTTVSDIAREAEVAQGTVYLYFDSKKAIFSALVDQTLDLFREVQKQGTPIHKLQTVQQLHDGLPRVYRQVLGLFASNRTLVRLMLTEVRGADPEVEEKLADFYRQVVAEMAADLQVGIDRGFIRPDMNPTLAAQCFIGMMERIAALVLTEEDLDLDAMALELARLELFGIADPRGIETASWQDNVKSS